MKIALIGQPNCGKSTLFNSVVGYRSETSNLAGTTVQASTGLVKLNGGMVELIDLPGIYSLTTSTPAEATTRRWLWESHPGLIINVVDASLLSRSLELTLELRELGIPMVVCLNMMDEAQRKGTGIAVQKLAETLGMPVLLEIPGAILGRRALSENARVILRACLWTFLIALAACALIRVIPGEADPSLFHRVPAPLAG